MLCQVFVQLQSLSISASYSIESRYAKRPLYSNIRITMAIMQRANVRVWFQCRMVQTSPTPIVLCFPFILLSLGRHQDAHWHGVNRRAPNSRKSCAPSALHGTSHCSFGNIYIYKPFREKRSIAIESNEIELQEREREN